MGAYGSIWKHMGPYGTIQDHTGPYRTTLDHTGKYEEVEVKFAKPNRLKNSSIPYGKKPQLRKSRI